MIDEIKELDIDSVVSIEHKGINEYFDLEEISVDTLECFDIDDGLIVLIRCENYVLVSYEIGNVERHFFYEIYDEGSNSRFTKKDQFIKQFKIEVDDKPSVYKITEESPFITDDEEKRFCQFRSNKYFDSALVELTNNQWILYVGFEIESDNLII